jgi:t-SNARE complex subunit (syntaxin)
VEVVKSNMQILKDNVARINNLTRARLVEVDVGRDAEKNDELQGVIDQSNASITVVSKKLKEMEAANKELAANDATARTRQNMHATLQKKFAVMIRDFQEAQTQAKMSMEERLVREIRVVKPDVTGEEVARIMSQDDPSRIFQQELLGDLDHQRARQNLLFITERHRDILTLEKSIRELHQLFVDMAAMVMQQGELIDQIETSVANSVEHTAQANVELESAIKAQKCGRKKMCIIILLVIALLAIIIVPIVVTQLNH